MALRISLCDDAPALAPHSSAAIRPRRPDPPPTEPLLSALDDPYVPPLLLYLSDEPYFGQRFRYSGLEWEIVEYDDGWIARLVVD